MEVLFASYLLAALHGCTMQVWLYQKSRRNRLRYSVPNVIDSQHLQIKLEQEFKLKNSIS